MTGPQGPWLKYQQQQQPEQGPWLKYGASPAQAASSTPSAAPATSAFASEYPRLAAVGSAVKNAGNDIAQGYAGALKGVGSLVGSIDNTRIGRAINSVGTTPEKAQSRTDAYQNLVTPRGTAQRVGYGAEKSGEFLLPEAGAIGKVGEVAEDAPRAAKLIGLGKKVLTQGAAQGAISAEQGGSPVAGALIGGAAPVAGAAFRAVAPGVAEGALGIRRVDRAYGKTPGRALLDLTSGLRPATVARSAGGVIDSLDDRLTSIADAASVPRVEGAPSARLALPPGPVEREAVPLHEATAVVERPSILQPAAPMPPTFAQEQERALSPAPLPTRGPNGRMMPGAKPALPQAFSTAAAASRIPAAQAFQTPAESAAADFLSRLDAEGGNGVTHPAGAMPTDAVAHPLKEPLRTIRRSEPTQGVWMRPVAPTTGAAAPITPAAIGLRDASARINLRPALSEIDSRIERALAENNPDEVNALRRVRAHLTENAQTGEPIPPQVRPNEALDLKRGVRKRFANFTSEPEYDRKAASHASKAASHAIGVGLEDALGPEFTDANRKISSLIPVRNRAASVERGAGAAQRIGHRIAAHTGALTGAAAGGVLGYRHGGAEGALLGSTLGLVGPELLASPTAQVGLARTLYARSPVRLGTALIQRGAAAATRKP
jgi:hypothetical protein